MKTKSMSFAEFLEYMTDDRADAAMVVRRMLKTDQVRTVSVLNLLDDMGVRGEAIVKIYEDSGYNVKAFFNKVEARD